MNKYTTYVRTSKECPSAAGPGAGGVSVSSRGRARLGPEKRPAYVTVEAQGSLVLARVRNPSVEPPALSARRGVVQGFTRRSRGRMLDMVARIRPDQVCWFVTLTQRADLAVIGWKEAKRCRNAFRRRVGRAFPEFSAIWRMGLQQRVAIHYHLVIWSAPGLTWAWVERNWRELVGQDDMVRVDVQQLAGGKATMLYVAKYAAKIEQAPALELEEDQGEGLEDGGLDYMPYQAAEDDGSTGRWWGIWGKERLPWAVKTVLKLAISSPRWWFQFKRIARHRWPGVSDRRWLGFKLFVRDVEAWRWLPSWLGAESVPP